MVLFKLNLSTSFRTISKIIRQSHINNYMVQCAGTNRSNLVVHHDVVGMYERGSKMLDIARRSLFCSHDI